jgi:hypothetical protein
MKKLISTTLLMAMAAGALYVYDPGPGPLAPKTAGYDPDPGPRAPITVGFDPDPGQLAPHQQA